MEHKLHACGGLLLSGPDHDYCERCHAFTTEPDGDVPSGTDRDANKAAWDNGEPESPPAATESAPAT